METLKVKIIRKRMINNTNGNVFYKYRTQMFLPETAGGEPIQHWIDVRFADSIDSTKLKTIVGMGYIEIYANDIETPDYYIIKDKIDKKTGKKIEGKKEYPHAYVKDFIKFTAKKKVVRQSSFVVDEEDTETTDI